MKLVYLTILFFLFSSCSRKLSAAEYLAFCDTHPEAFESSIDLKNKYELKYTPVEMRIAEFNGDYTSKEIKKELEINKNKNVSYFNFSITVPTGNLFNQTNRSTAEQMLYYSTAFKKDIVGIQMNNDTILCTELVFQANAGFGNTSYFELEFPSNIQSLKELRITSKMLKDSIIKLDLKTLHHSYPKLKIK